MSSDAASDSSESAEESKELHAREVIAKVQGIVEHQTVLNLKPETLNPKP